MSHVVESTASFRTARATGRPWQLVRRAISAAVAMTAVGGAIYLGATGPLVSPVQTAPAATAADPTTGSPDVVQPSDRGFDARARGDVRAFGRHR